MQREFAILFRKEINEYDFGEGHPFHGRRGEDFLNFLKKKINPIADFPLASRKKVFRRKTLWKTHYGVKIDFPILRAEKASDEDLELICEKDYIEFTKKYFEKANKGESFNGNFFKYHSTDNLPVGKPGKIEEAARYIIGQAKLACDLVCQGKYKKVISVGGGLHHAKRNYGEGFCVYNDVAFCGKYLIEKYNLKRILILDTDAHAGNGTLEYFYDSEKVLFIDLHQDPRSLYPGTGFIKEKGVGRGEGLKINIPLPPGAGDESYKICFEEIVEPVVKEFKPQIIIRNGGSDPHFSDQLTNLGLTIEGFKMIGEKVRKLAKICNGKEIDLIASGYNLKILPFCWLALISRLIGIEIEIEETFPIQKIEDPIDQTEKVIKEIKKEFKNYWKCFR